MMNRLSRRALLRGAGCAVSLPLFEAMLPSAHAHVPAGDAPQRLAFLYVPNGADMKRWTPEAEGADYELTPILEPLAKHKSKFNVLTGLTHDKGRANGDGPGDHARAAATFLTGVQPYKADGKVIRVGVSADQIAAKKIGNATRLRSLELGCEAGRQAGQCDSGYPCAYSNNISWHSPHTPAIKEVRPRLVFDRLLGRHLAGGDPEQIAARKSILDYVREDAERLSKKLGASDRRKLDEYLTGVRELERRIARAEDGDPDGFDGVERPGKKPKDYGEHIRLMMDLLVLAFRTDTTRIATFMLANEGSNRSYRHLDVPEGHHTLSHHGGDRSMVAKISKINTFHIEQFAYFLDNLAKAEEGESSLLDHSLIVYGSGIADGNRHNHDHLPCILAGSGGGIVETGRHVRYAPNTPMNNLHLALLEKLGVGGVSLGDGTGILPV